MKKIVLAILFASFILPGFSQVEDIAKEVLEAYKKRNAEDLKKHASAFFKYSISDSYFDESEIQRDLEYVDNWNGDINEIRYSTGDMMGNTVNLASVYYADNPDNSDEICVVILSSTDEINWVMFAGGLGTETKEEFEKMSLSLKESKETAAKEPSKVYDLEMADGSKFSNAKQDKIVDCIDKLNDDNFFVILSSGDDYIQAAFSEQGFIVQYSEEGKQFEAMEYLTKSQVEEIFKKYYQNGNWKEGNEWIEPSY